MKTYNENGVTGLILDMIAPGLPDNLAMEGLRLGVAMLFKEGGALDVQMSIWSRLHDRPSDMFFLQSRKIIQRLITQHKRVGVVILASDEDEPDLPETYMLLQFLQLFCEGHNHDAQDLIREQPNNQTSINLLDDFVALLDTVSHYPCRTSSAAADNVCSVILEILQGPCEGNQTHFALNTELLEIANRMMRSGVENDCNVEDEDGIKKNIMDILQALLEGQHEGSPVLERLLSVIHLDVMQMICNPDDDSITATITDTMTEDEVVAALEAAAIAQEERAKALQDLELTELQTESLVLLQMLIGFKPQLRNEIKFAPTLDKILGKSVAMVEVLWRGQLHKRFFNIPVICLDLPEVTKAQLLDEINREVQEKQLLDFARRGRWIYKELKHQQYLQEKGLDTVFNRQYQNYSTWMTFLFAIAINLLYLSAYRYDPSLNEYTGSHDVTNIASPYLPAHIIPAAFTLKALHLAFAVTCLVMYCVVRAPVSYSILKEAGDTNLAALIGTLTSGSMVYYAGYVVCAMLGTFVSPLFFSLLLLDIVTKDGTAMDVVKALRAASKQLLMIVIMTLFVIYIMAFFYVSFDGRVASVRQFYFHSLC